MQHLVWFDRFFFLQFCWSRPSIDGILVWSMSQHLGQGPQTSPTTIAYLHLENKGTTNCKEELLEKILQHRLILTKQGYSLDLQEKEKDRGSSSTGCPPCWAHSVGRFWMVLDGGSELLYFSDQFLKRVPEWTGYKEMDMGHYCSQVMTSLSTAK